MTHHQQILDKKELNELEKISALRGIGSIILTWSLIVFSFGLVYIWPNFITITIAIILIGGRQLALGILMHEAAHNTLLPKIYGKDLISRWLICAPLAFDLRSYREEHLNHHRYLGTNKDPDTPLTKPYPTTKRKLLKRFIRDKSGQTALTRIIGIYYMATGHIAYTSNGNIQRLGKPSKSKALKNLTKNLYPTIVFNLILFAILSMFEPSLYLLWLGSYMTTFSLFLRIRSIAEHAGLPNIEDQFFNARNLSAGILERLTIAPHGVNYHLDHHLFMQIPHYHLSKLHKALNDKVENRVSDSYSQMLATVIKET